MHDKTIMQYHTNRLHHGNVNTGIQYALVQPKTQKANKYLQEMRKPFNLFQKCS